MNMSRPCAVFGHARATKSRAFRNPRQGPGARSITSAGKVQWVFRSFGRLFPGRYRKAFDADGIHGTNRQAEPTAIAPLRQSLTGFIPAALGTDIPAVVTFRPFIVIIKATVFINNKVTHSECFDTPGKMSCQKNKITFCSYKDS